MQYMLYILYILSINKKTSTSYKLNKHITESSGQPLSRFTNFQRSKLKYTYQQRDCLKKNNASLGFIRKKKPLEKCPPKNAE